MTEPIRGSKLAPGADPTPPRPTEPPAPPPPAPRMALAPPATVLVCSQWPPAHLPCFLAPGHAGWHEGGDGIRWSREPDIDVLTVAGLTDEQDIRARALTTAAAIMDVALIDEAQEAADVVLEVAEKLAAYIATGAPAPTTEIRADLGPIIAYEVHGRMYPPDEVTVIHEPEPSTVEAP